MEFDTYVPFRQNHFLLATPWRETFSKIFVETPEVRQQLERLFTPIGSEIDPPVHFYFTRSNVGQGRLEFSTNWPGLRNLRRVDSLTGIPKPVIEADRYEIIDGSDLDEALHKLLDAVFASMDLPPLFPYMKIGVGVESWYEDGGVIDNLPILFGTEIEQCDLLFILPLNASFVEQVNQTSVIKRLARVMDVRQGVLERNSFKLAYLYNELASLRNAQPSPQVTQPAALLQARALRRSHKPVSLFTICPQPPLKVETAEFWKPQEAGSAFDQMYAATKHELEEGFEEDTRPDWIRMTLVSPEGERTYFDNF